MSEFQKMYVRRPGNRKHSFFITWIFNQLTDLRSNYAIQLKQISDICEVWNVVSVQFRKKIKEPSFCGGVSF